MKEKLIKVINKAIKECNIDYNDEIILEIPKQKNFGDYSSNIALKLTKTLNQNPMDIASMIKEKMISEDIKDIEIVKPGFINIFVNKNYLFENINKIINEKENYGKNDFGKGKSVNIEFVSANPTGILHMGNARGGAYGDSLARILKFVGYDVTKEYYINDAGNQIDNLALSIKARYYELCSKEFEIPVNGYHGKEIIDIAKVIYDKEKETFLDKDLDYYKQIGIDYLMSKIKKVLKDFNIEYDIFTSEKDIRKKYPLENIIEKLDKSGYVYEKDNAKWFKCTLLYDDKDHVLKKEDGTYTYLVPDIAYHFDKYKRGYDKIIDVLGTDHHGYVNRLKSSIKAMGNNPDSLEVKLLQLVKLVKNGEVVKMSKRTGNSVSLDELINDVGVNAARYYFSKTSLDTQMDFDLTLAKEKSNENPVFYVSYAYARICSILNNYKEKINTINYSTIKNEKAFDLLQKLYMFNDVVLSAAKKELPHLITNYVYELASLFHSFYSEVKIITEDEKATAENINIILATKIVLKNALNLIGVEPPEKM